MEIINGALSSRGCSLLPRAVLVAIAIPIFTSQLEKSRDATSVANMRSAYAEAQTLALTGKDGDTDGNATYADTTDGFTVTVSGVAIKSQKADSWSGLSGDLPFTAPTDPGSASDRSLVFTYKDNELDSVAFGS